MEDVLQLQQYDFGIRKLNVEISKLEMLRRQILYVLPHIGDDILAITEELHNIVDVLNKVSANNIECLMEEHKKSTTAILKAIKEVK